MSNAFEDAMHQGFSAEEMAQEMERIVNELGCPDCIYKDSFICHQLNKNGYTRFHLDKCIIYTKEEK